MIELGGIRPSIGRLMAVVLLVAADFGILRGFWGTRTPAVAVCVLTMPMLNLLILVLPKLRRGQAGRPFWLGFQVFGGLAVLLVAFVCWNLEDELLAPFMALRDRLWARIQSPEIGVTIDIVAATLLYTPPQVLAAWLGGRLSTRYRLVVRLAIERR